jgi:hypothetical protein
MSGEHPMNTATSVACMGNVPSSTRTDGVGQGIIAKTRLAQFRNDLP